MNKDALLATVIGFGIGLLLTAVVFIGPSLVKNMPAFALPRLTSASPSPQPQETNRQPTRAPGEAKLIESPLDDAVETQSQILISGNTYPNAVVVITAEAIDAVVTANADGAYAGNIALEEGKNIITVTSYAGDSADTQSVIVYYTPENF